MTIEVALLISMLGLATSMYFSNKSSKRTDKKDIEDKAIETTKAMTEMNMTLKGVAKNVETIMTELCDTKDQVADLNLRVTIAESGLKDTAREVNTIHDKVQELSDRVSKVEG